MKKTTINAVDPHAMVSKAKADLYNTFRSLARQAEKIQLLEEIANDPYFQEIAHQLIQAAPPVEAVAPRLLPAPAKRQYKKHVAKAARNGHFSRHPTGRRANGDRLSDLLMQVVTDHPGLLTGEITQVLVKSGHQFNSTKRPPEATVTVHLCDLKRTKQVKSVPREVGRVASGPRKGKPIMRHSWYPVGTAAAAAAAAGD